MRKNGMNRALPVKSILLRRMDCAGIILVQNKACGKSSDNRFKACSLGKYCTDEDNKGNINEL
ncbi:MAG: hypothetical protein MZV63_21810 [Marinilabiliales bacterium]|nr:hypothetical protein [Marinilabiliales bacterium]